MISQDLVTKIENLSLDDQLSLMEVLTRLVNRRIAKAITPQNSLERVRGLLKPAPGEPMPTEAELADDYTDYLLKKYA
jgi:hypothetical protein